MKTKNFFKKACLLLALSLVTHFTTKAQTHPNPNYQIIDSFGDLLIGEYQNEMGLLHQDVYWPHIRMYGDGSLAIASLDEQDLYLASTTNNIRLEELKNVFLKDNVFEEESSFLKSATFQDTATFQDPATFESSATFQDPATFESSATFQSNVNAGGVLKFNNTYGDSGAIGGNNESMFINLPEGNSTQFPDGSYSNFEVLSSHDAPVFSVSEYKVNGWGLMGYLVDYGRLNRINARGVLNVDSYLHVGRAPQGAGLLGEGTFPDLIDGAIAHFDGRVYVSEDDKNLHDGDSATEAGFDDDTSDNYKDYLLWVEKGMVAEDIALVEIEDWPDYVFDNNYNLSTLKDVESFIAKNKHLPSMLPGSEIEKVGFSGKDMFKRVVLTLEELTLHTIEQENTIERQEKVLESQNEEIQDLKDDVEELKAALHKLLKDKK